MTIACGWCEQLIEGPNHNFPGFCSPSCRDAARENRRDRHGRRPREDDTR